MMPAIGAIYARYSSDLQDETSIADQIGLSERRAAANGHGLPEANRFTDYAKSGASVMLRDGYKAMMKAAYDGDFTILYIENVSRLSRNNGDVQKAIEHLTFLGITVIEAATNTVLDPMGAAVKGLVAHLTREQTAQMVRRGLDGIVRNGFTAGGRAYGYQSAPRHAHEKRRGGILLIVEDQARIIIEIFERYAAGETPRAIAADLNERGVKPPRGSRWAASCIHGEAARGSGILNNELYVGRIVWNKSRMVVNPNTGKRVSRRNDAGEWVRAEAEHLRIVSHDLWDAVAARKAKKRQEPPQRARAAKRVFSGLLRCGACGSGMSTKGTDKTGRTRFQCSRHKESGDCPDPRSYYIDEIEARVLGLLRSELQEPDAIRDFLETYEAEMKRLRMSSTTQRASLEAELVKASARAERLNNLLMDGLCDPVRTQPELQATLTKENDLRQRLAAIATPSVVVLHPGARERYLTAVARLHETLGKDGESEAAKVVREVIETVVLHPAGASRNRHTPPPKIEIIGRLEALIGQRFLLPAAVGDNEALASLPPADFLAGGSNRSPAVGGKAGSGGGT
nr:recombinase family protein [uncultured Sphingomonas sp.]